MLKRENITGSSFTARKAEYERRREGLASDRQPSYAMKWEVGMQWTTCQSITVSHTYWLASLMWLTGPDRGPVFVVSPTSFILFHYLALSSNLVGDPSIVGDFLRFWWAFLSTVRASQ